MPSTVYKIQETKKTEGSFLLDTNILVWYTYEGLYPAGKEPKHWQASNYPDFIKTLLQNKNVMYYSLYSLGELYHYIERLYVELYNERYDPKDDNYIKYAKELRRSHPEEKSRLDSLFRSMCIDIRAIATPIPTFHDVSLERISDLINNYQLDAVDALIYHSMDSCGIRNIVSDDSDFGFADGINLYTANNHVSN